MLKGDSNSPASIGEVDMEVVLPEITPQKKSKLSIDYNYCIICQQENKKQEITKNISKSSLDTLIERCRKRFEFKDTKVFDFVTRIKEIDAETILKNNGFYHRDCYKTFANIIEVSRAENRFNTMNITSSSQPALIRKRGRPTNTTSQNFQKLEEKQMLRRSETTPYDKKLCILCQKESAIPIHAVQTTEMGVKMLEVSQQINDKGFNRRLNTIPNAHDAHANDVLYHNACWIRAKREAQKHQEPVGSNNFLNSLADIEIIHFVENTLMDPSGKVLNMNIVNSMYQRILSSFGESSEIFTDKNDKKRLKDLIARNVDDVKFVKDKNPSKPEQLISCRTESHILDAMVNEVTTDAMEKLWKSAKIIRNELLNCEKWKFEETYDDFKLPTLLSTFLKWVLIGPTNLENDSDIPGVDKTVSMVSQVIMQNVKSKYQVNKSANGAYTKSMVETPLNVGLGIMLHQQTRSKVLVDTLSNMNLSISYQKVLGIKNQIVVAVEERIKDNNSIYFPSKLSKDEPIFFAVDNADLRIDTADGKNQLHGTVLVAYQNGEIQEQPSISLNRKITRGHKPFHETLYSIDYCPAPERKKVNYENYLASNSSTTLDLYRDEDRVWSIFKSLSGEFSTIVPTWAAYNSILSEKRNTTKICTLPLINGSPTDWSNLFGALKIAQNITDIVKTSAKTIISADLQLYSKCVQSQDGEINKNYIFRMGELHVVFTVLKVLGKVIDNSGLDQSLEEAGIYGPNTISQIKDGKHLYRSLEAHFVIYLTLFQMYVNKIFEQNTDLFEKIQNIVDSNINENTFDATIAHLDLKTVLSTSGFVDLQEKFDNSVRNQALFYLNYMKLFELLLLFIRATRQQIWSLHLSSLHELSKYFFSFDMINYARLTPVYLSQMHNLKQTDKDIWDYFENGSFSVNKSSVPFTAIGVDHALEQENRSMKVHGGIKGIANKQQSTDQYFVVAPEVSNIVKNFQIYFNILQESDQETHYQLSGSKNKRITANITKLKNVFDQHEISFEDTDCVYNAVTKKILPETVAKRFLNHKEEGEKHLNNFINERIDGEKSIWEPLTKNKLPTFASNAKTIKVKIGSAEIDMKEERNIMSRLIIASRSRPEIDISNYFGKYEFSVVPRALFTTDGLLIKTTDKFTVVQELEKVFPDIINKDKTTSEINFTMIVDGMAIANKINIQKCKLKTCKDFANMYSSIVLKESEAFSEVRVLFDRYEELSLKSATRNYRTLGTQIQYKIDDDTVIENVSTSKFLSHVKTKRDLTQYLSKKLATKLAEVGKRYVIVYDTTTLTNISNLTAELKEHSHEEADTLIILHAIDIAKNDPFIQLYIFCSDTDVLLLLIYFYQQICNHTIFRSRRADIDVGRAYNNLGDNRRKAILGFHAFTGCDQTGKFKGHSKLSCFKLFMQSDSDVLDSFSKLGEPNAGLASNSTIGGLIEFVLNLYKLKRPSNITTLAELRWYLFSKYQLDASKLPPTQSSLIFGIYRSHLICSIWKQSDKPHPTYLSITEFGWTHDGRNNSYEAVTTNEPPAPEQIIELCICKCTSGCDTRRCKCLKNQLVCTEMCLCQRCENTNIENEITESDEDSSED